MGLQQALFSSVSGLDVASTAITVSGDNIANVNTPGFKERRAEFANVLGQSISAGGGFSQLGAGTKLARVGTVFTQGTFENTGRRTDLAIEGAGFFMLRSGQGDFVTRAGIFGVDLNGNVVNPEGMNLQGFGIDQNTGLSNGQVGDIVLSTSISAPRESDEVELSVNLDSRTPITSAFDPANPEATSNHRTVVTQYDTQGNPHPATYFFTKTAANTWTINATLGVNDTTTAPTNPPDTIVRQGSQITMVFDDNGAITSHIPETGGAGSGYTATTFNYAGLTSGAQTVNVSFGSLANNQSGVDATTQFASSSATSAFVQNGYAPGTLQGIAIDRDGYVTGQFSNGESINLALVALANFANVEELSSVGNNRLVESRGSGQALVGAPQSGTFGSIRSSAIEQSNVDLATQFVRLIINQRAFQANTRTISVTNELLAQLNTLGQ